MKKIFTILFLSIFLLSNSVLAVSDKNITKTKKQTKIKKVKKQTKKINYKKCFIITGYYSPLPGQRYYATGSYYRDIILNGRGARGASGKRVFSGMLAAPGNYSFGTKIYLNGLGIAEVSDRGGAIVNAGVRGHVCDRIDIWLGYGETGLKRALYWGKRKVYGNFVSRKSRVTLNIKNFRAPNSAFRAAFRVYSNPVFYKGIGTKNPKSDVIALQKYLKKKCLYNGKIDGNYHSILYIILNIQKKHKLIKTGNELYAGYWSYNTRKLFLSGKVKNGICTKKLPLSNFPPKGERIATKKVIAKKIVKKQIPLSCTLQHDPQGAEILSPKKREKEATKKVVKKNIYPLEKVFEKSIGKKSNIEDIKNYQKVLKEIGMYKGKIDGNYNNIIGIISDFQVKEKLIKDKTNPATGFIGPGTRKKLKQKYINFIDNKIKTVQEEEKKKAEIEKQKQQKQNEVAEIVNSMAKLELGAKGENVKILQKTLKHYGFFNYEETGYFGEKTKESLIKYQISRKIIKTKDDIGAGYVGPKTREFLKKDLLTDKALLGKIKGTKTYAVLKIEKKV